jgi:hypothetical protein
MNWRKKYLARKAHDVTVGYEGFTRCESLPRILWKIGARVMTITSDVDDWQLPLVKSGA